MWTRLDQPDIVECYKCSALPGSHPAIEHFLSGLSSRSWAREIFATMSMGRLSLTTAPSWDKTAKNGFIRVDCDDSGRIKLSYVPPHKNRSAVTFVCNRDEEIGKLELLLLRLFEDAGSLPPDALSKDCDDNAPRFETGDSVDVVQNERNRTPHRGTIRDRIWHHKHGCWNYYLLENGKKLKKRYLAEDLLLIGQASQEGSTIDEL